MEADIWMPISLFIILLVFSAFFSGSESAFFSLSQADLNRIRERSKKNRVDRRVIRLMENPKRLLSSILIGNTIVNVAAATVAALFVHRLQPFGEIQSGDLFLEIVIVTLSILFFSEISPKVFALKKSTIWAYRVSFLMWGIVIFLTPFSYLFEKTTQIVSSLFRIQKEPLFINSEELKTLIEVGEEKGTLDKAEKEMIHSIFEFRETMVKEVMVPRMDMVCIEKETPFDEILGLAREKGHSRIPVYSDNVDNILGILFVKDLLPYLSRVKDVPSLKELARSCYFVPESKYIDELLREFQKERIHMAIVVDEYGGTAGLITLEDVLEEIVGEIHDEYDKEKPLIRKENDHTWFVDAKIDIEELNERLGLSIPTEGDYESLGGFIFHLMGHIPQEKESIEYHQYKLVVEKVVRQRIKSVRIVQKKIEDHHQENHQKEDN